MVFGPSVYDVPLLPYERELIKTIGITEEEYQLFAAEVRQRGRLRPAEYDHIPDIVCEPTTLILVNLAISLVLTGVSYLLMPKPKMPSASRGSSFDTGSITGPSRFTPTRGFETLNELADYASPIPIIFGLYQGQGRGEAGGIFVTPKLVWSRMFSYGTQQSALLMFVVGEQGVDDGVGDGIKPPALEGIMLGNNALDPIHQDQFAFYWRAATTTPAGPRIKGADLKYGTQGTADSGNPGVGLATDDVKTEDVFLAPTNEAEQSKPFCHAYSPANSMEFGAYAPIANGSGVKVNYKVIPIGRNVAQADSDASETKKSQRAKVMQRVKIVGDENQARKRDTEEGKSPGSSYSKNVFVGEDILEQHQSGTGRQYSPRMGLISITQGNTVITTNGDKYTRPVRVAKDDTAVFLISDTKIDEEVYKTSSAAVSVNDINSLVFESQLAAYEQMQKGEIFAIAGTLWKVINRRKEGVFRAGGGAQFITLKCIDTSMSASKTVGIVSKNLVVHPPIYIDDRRGVGPNYYPLTRMSIASIRNNRAAVITELGIKSIVYQRLNGLTAINGLPTPDEIKEFGKDKTTVTTGAVNIFIPRASAFRIATRKANASTNTEFVFFDEYFVIIGNRPIAQYNYIQIIAPNRDNYNELEFKIVPVPGSEIKHLSTEQEFIHLKSTAEGGDQAGGTTRVPGIGSLKIKCSGIIVDKTFFSDNAELGRGARIVNIAGATDVPKNLKVVKYLPQNQNTNRFKAQSIEKLSFVSTPATGVGKNGAFSFALAGDPDIDGPNTKTTKTTEYYNNNTEFIKLRWQWVKRVIANPNQYARKFNGQNKAWDLVSCTVINSSPGFPLNHEFEVRRGLNKTNTVDSNGNLRPTNVDYGDRNPFKHNNPDISDGVLRGSGYKFKVTDTTLIQGEDKEQAYLFETFGRAVESDLDDVKRKVLSKTKSGKHIEFTLRAKVVRLQNHPTGEKFGYSVTQIVQRLDNTTSGWQVGDSFNDLVEVTAQNPFGIKDSTAGAKYEVESVQTTATTVSYEGENFEFNNGYADLSFYRQLIEKSNDAEPEHQLVYVNEIVPNAREPQYSRLTTVGLSLKASRAFSRLDQLRCWLASGLKVKRLHPDWESNEDNPYEDDSTSRTFKKEFGPSHLFPDLVFYLMTDQMAGAGGLMNMTSDNAPLVDLESFKLTAKFLSKQRMFFNGVITERTNLRQFIANFAPYFLCNFIINNGKFGLLPAIPFLGSGDINTGSIEVGQLFTAGNILEDSFNLEYLRFEDRRPFVAVARYRKEMPNKFPEEKSVVVFEKGSKPDNMQNLPQETFDLTQFCTSEKHAIKVARYFLALRKLVTHTIKFSTTVFGLSIKAGSFIKVITESSPYSSANNGTVDGSGNVVSVKDLEDGQYDVLYHKTDADTDVEEGKMTVSGGKVSESKFHNSVFTINDLSVSENIYVVEQLTFSQEGTVDIVASEHPCTTEANTVNISKLALAVIDEAGDYEVVTG